MSESGIEASGLPVHPRIKHDLEEFYENEDRERARLRRLLANKTISRREFMRQWRNEL